MQPRDLNEQRPVTVSGKNGAADQPAAEEATQTAFRVAIAQASYNAAFADVRAQEDARRSLAYFAVTATLGILGYYIHVRSGFALDPARIDLANYLFPAGFFLLYVISRVGHGRYIEECASLRAAAAQEMQYGIEKGTAMQKLMRYAASTFWQPSRVNVACGGASAALFITMLLHHWQY